MKRKDIIVEVISLLTHASILLEGEVNKSYLATAKKEIQKANKLMESYELYL